MKYLPFENIVYKSKLDIHEVKQRLGEVIEPKKTFRMTGIFGSGNHKPYEGSINGNSFNISRIIGYGNPFLPRIKGTIEKDINGTRLNVRMRLHPLFIIFMIIWFGGVGIGCLVVLITYKNQDFEPMTLIPFGMLIFGYALVTRGFKFESITSRRYLAELFEARIEK